MIRVGIVGYGNLGKAIVNAAENFEDIEISAIFSRRTPLTESEKEIPVIPFCDVLLHKDKIDVLAVTHGSVNDACKTVLNLCESFNTVDSFDMHHDITKHRKNVGNVAKNCNNLSLVSVGWDPGLMSVMRTYFSAFMPYTKVNSFWGKGVSQGHSQAIRSIPGVKYAVQYTIPIDESVICAKNGISVSPVKSHKRVCYVVADKIDQKRIENEIRNMPGYFMGYSVDVHFIDEKEFLTEHKSLYHNGEVIAVGKVNGEPMAADLLLNIGSNPDFTAHIMLASARALSRLYSDGVRGALTMLDVPPRYFLPAMAENPE